MTGRSPDTLFLDDADVTRLKAGVLAGAATADRRRTRKHRLLALGIAGAVAAATTAGAVAIARASQGQINYTADCYAAASLDSQHGTSLYLPGDQTSKRATPLAERVRLAEAMCAETWRIGTFSSTPGADGSYPVPDLTVCQLPDDRLAVFPSARPPGQLCPDLGLTTPHD